jgi:hypothetical protein
MDLLLESLLKLGGTGLVAGVLWKIANRCMDETVGQMSARITALEAAVVECAKERKEMQEKLFDFLTHEK